MYKLEINNFRSFQNEIFDFSRINILIGENSSGKSSLLKFLLILKQTIESPKEANLLLSGELSDVGNYKEAIYYRKTNKSISFQFTFDKDYSEFYLRVLLGPDGNKNNKVRNELLNQLKEAFLQKTSIRFQINKDLETHNSILIEIKNDAIGTLEIKTVDDPKELDKIILPNKYPKAQLRYFRKNSKPALIYENVGYDKRGFLTIIIGTELEFVLKNNEIFNELAFLLITQNYIEYQLSKIKFINPLNNRPKRVYLKKELKGVYKTIDLEKFIDLIHSQTLGADFLNKFQKILVEFGIADEVKVISAKEIPVMELRVKIKDLLSNISDVGYGVSLQLPILFEALSSEKKGGNTFLIEQPEVHLHPKLQSEFIKTLISIGNKNKYIIETHSEHIIRMLQIIVKENKLGISPEDVSIYYLKRERKKSVVTKHSLDNNGILLPNFPSGFFDASYALAKQLLI